MTKTLTTMTAAEARQLTSEIRNALAVADDKLVKAWEARAWAALDYGSWGEYVEKELPHLRLLKALPDRKSVV